MLPIKASGTATLIVVFAERTSTIPEPVVSLSDLSCKVRSGNEWAKLDEKEGDTIRRKKTLRGA